MLLLQDISDEVQPRRTKIEELNETARAMTIDLPPHQTEAITEPMCDVNRRWVYVLEVIALRKVCHTFIPGSSNLRKHLFAFQFICSTSRSIHLHRTHLHMNLLDAWIHSGYQQFLFNLQDALTDNT